MHQRDRIPDYGCTCVLNTRLWRHLACGDSEARLKSKVKVLALEAASNTCMCCGRLLDLLAILAPFKDVHVGGLFQGHEKDPSRSRSVPELCSG